LDCHRELRGVVHTQAIKNGLDRVEEFLAATGRRDKSRMLARRMKRTAGHDGMVVIDYLLKRS
jgi:hypothetical protein